MANEIENLTPAQRTVLERGHSTHVEVLKALRIIDQLVRSHEALQARVLELEGTLAAETPEALERLRGLLSAKQLCVVKFTDVLDLGAARSDLAILRGRVERAERELAKSIHPAARRALEALRGR